jgi:hypothetical protein
MNEVLGGLSRLTFQMTVATLPQAKLLRATELLGTQVKPLIQKELGTVLTQSRVKTV